MSSGQPSPTRPETSRSVMGILCVMIAALAMLRLPFILFGPGMQDENWFSVPGWTVAHEGIPRMPYVPVEDRESVFYRANEVLFALPPAFFYVQAPFFWIFPATYATARLPSWIAGMVVLFLIFRIAKRLEIRDSIAIAAVVICGMSRPFFFAWTNARPDMMCAAFGLSAMLVALKYLDHPSRRVAAIAGLFVGLGMLSHPFGIVFAFQLAIVMLLLAHGVIWKERILCLTIAGIVAAATLLLWVPLILVDPEAFWVQFSNNVLSRSGPGLISRLLWPWSSLTFQIALFQNRNGVFQSVLCGLAILAGVVLCLVKRNRAVVRGVTISFSAMYLHLASVGSHTVIDYWCYTWAWVTLLTVLVLEAFATSIVRFRYFRLATAIVILAIIASLAPGSGVRPFWVYLSRYGEVDYNRTAFCRQLAERFPKDAKLIVASDYVFEFEALGRKPVNASLQAMYQNVSGLDFDYWIASRSNTLEELPQSLGCEKLYSLGNWDDSLSCYVDVYAAPVDDTPRKPWPR